MINEMIQVLLNDGWIQGDLANEQGQVCLLGARNKVKFGKPEADWIPTGRNNAWGMEVKRPEFDTYDSEGLEPIVRAIYELHQDWFRQHTEDFEFVLAEPDSWDSVVYSFNDDENTTEQMVLEVLRKAAELELNSTGETD